MHDISYIKCKITLLWPPEIIFGAVFSAVCPWSVQSVCPRLHQQQPEAEFNIRDTYQPELPVPVPPGDDLYVGHYRSSWQESGVNIWYLHYGKEPSLLRCRQRLCGISGWWRPAKHQDSVELWDSNSPCCSFKWPVPLGPVRVQRESCHSWRFQGKLPRSGQGMYVTCFVCFMIETKSSWYHTVAP